MRYAIFLWYAYHYISAICLTISWLPAYLCSKKKKMTKIKKYGYIAAGAVAVAGIAGAAYVFGHRPDVVKSPCFRSCFRADGCPKMPFNSAWRANLQSVIQLFRYGEVCNSYQVGDRYYTGHSKNAIFRSINIFK